MRKLLLGSAVLFGVFLLAGCGDDDGSSNTASVSTQARSDGSDSSATEPKASVERCTGTYVCSSVDGAVTTTNRVELEKTNDGCALNAVTLHPDGGIALDGTDTPEARWSKTADGFDICVGSAGCIVCTLDASSPTKTPESSRPAPSAKKCGGYASSCSGRAAGSCGSQEGCSFNQHTHFGWNGEMTLESECEGSADSCSTFTDEEACTHQDGCSWE